MINNAIICSSQENDRKVEFVDNSTVSKLETVTMPYERQL